MKKTLSIGFGFVLIASAIVPFSLASRDAYHTYLYQASRSNQLELKKESTSPFRPFSVRKGQFGDSRRVERGSNLRGTNPSKNLRYSLGNTRNFYTQTEGSLRPLRPSTRRVSSAWQANLNRRGPVALKKIKNAVEVFETFENDTFSVQVPQGWEPSEEMTHFFESYKADFTINIEKIDNACQNLSFTTCAIALSTDRNHQNPAEKISASSSIERQTHFSDTVLNENIQTRTFTESFNGYVGSDEKYIARFFVADLQGGVYLIETTTSVDNASRFVGVSKQIFDSFRIKE